MSGQLVGEVIDALPALKASGLTTRGFYTLIAIAEKCHADTRQGSVRWDHIRNCLFGASKRTAERGVEELKSIGVLRVVKPGFNNNHGRMHSPIYEVALLTDTDTQVTASPRTDTDTQVSVSHAGDADRSGTDADRSGDRCRQIGDRYRHPGVVLDGSIDGPPDGSTDAPSACAGADVSAGAIPSLFGTSPRAAAQPPAIAAVVERPVEPAGPPCIFDGREIPAVEDGKCGRHLALERAPNPKRPNRARRGA